MLSSHEASQSKETIKGEVGEKRDHVVLFHCEFSGLFKMEF